MHASAASTRGAACIATIDEVFTLYTAPHPEQKASSAARGSLHVPHVDGVAFFFFFVAVTEASCTLGPTALGVGALRGGRIRGLAVACGQFVMHVLVSCTTLPS